MRTRSTHVVVAVTSGLAVGVLLYRFATLGVLSVEGLRVVVPCIVAVLLGAVAVLYAIHTRGERLHPATRSAIAIASIGVATGVMCFAAPLDTRIPLVRKELPGFSIELPIPVPNRKQIDYGAGTIEYRDLAAGSIKLLWSGRASVDLLDQTLRLTAKKLKLDRAPIDLSLPGPRGLSTRTLGLDLGKEGMSRLSEVVCGTRALQLMTVGHAEMEATHRRILASIKCTPDPAREIATDSVRIALELRGWTALEKMRGVRALTDGRTTLSLSEGPPRKWNTSELAAAVPVVLAENGLQVTTKAPVGDRVPLEGSFEGVSMVGWTRVLTCPTNSVMLIALAFTSEESEATYNATKNARCLRDGEAPSDWPLASE